MKALPAIALAVALASLVPQPALAARMTIFDWFASLEKDKPAKKTKVADPMKALRMKMIDGRASQAEMRRLADSGDTLAAFLLAKQLEESGDPEQLGTAGYLYMKALRGGREAAIRPLIRILQSGGLAEQPRNTAESEELLLKAAAKGDAIARDGLIAMYRGGTPFGAQPEKAEELLIASAEGGDPQAAFDLAIALLTGTPEPAEREQAKAMLGIAAASDDLSLRTMAENILRTLTPMLTASTETVQ